MTTKHLRKLIFALTALLGTIPVTGAYAQDTVDEDVTATWAFDLGTEGQTATFTPEGGSEWFNNCYVTLGSNLFFPTNNPRTFSGLTETLIEPLTKESGASETNAIRFIISPKKGLTFTPTKVSFKATRVGTGGGYLDIAWENPDGTKVTLDTGQNPARNSSEYDPQYSTYEYDVTGATAAEGECGLLINLYNLDSSKQVGFGEIVIEGHLSGEIEQVSRYTVTVSVSPEDAGKVSTVPSGTEFDEGTSIHISQERNFGYKFINWTDNQGNELSTASEFDYVISSDVTITANYEKINTYALDYSATGGGKDYMITPVPTPTDIDGKHMYEEGQEVTLTATGNYILSFSNWSTGETTSEIKLTMTGDMAVTAAFAVSKDYIAGWDFYTEGKEGRKADFYADENDAVTLVMRDEAGTSSSWLDKSQIADGGYEGRPAAVNWTKEGLGKYYWQTQVNAEAFTDIKVMSAMLINYNSYSRQDVEYSLDGQNWTKIGTFELTATKQWWKNEFDLPAEADNQQAVYIRWKADTGSELLGTTSDNDGIAISGIYITGTENLIDDGTAPVLESTVPAEGATNASANGRIVLNFDEKVKVKDGTVATLNSTQELQPTVSGKTVTFEYKGLSYDTDYTFVLPANSVSDLTGNTISEAVTINFRTMTRPVVQKAVFDFIVPDDGTITEALEAAAAREDVSKRFYIFVRQDDYVIPASETATVTGVDGKAYPSPITTVNTPNVSIIGEGMDNTSVVNTVPKVAAGTTNPIEGLGKCETFSFGKNATDMYLQDITIKNGLKDGCGRGAALEDGGDKNVFKNVCLYGYQDTYLSDNQTGRFYFEGGKLRGRTDFLCGKGDVFYNGVNLVMCEKGGYIAVPSTPKEYGYIFRDCVITGESDDIDGNYTLGRPWGSGTPIALYINTRMEVLPTAAGWSEMSDGWPARFAEYNSTTSSGTVISLNDRKKTFGDGHENNPVLTEEEAALLTIETVMGADDDWDPTSLTEQASAPTNVKITGNVLTWDDSQYILCWAICKDGKVTDFTITPEYTVDDESAKYSVRAANQMGGLGEAAEATVSTGINEIDNDGISEVVKTEYYSVQGERINSSYRGIVIEVSTTKDGVKTAKKIIRK